MKRFEFSLERLLNVKRQLERLAELEQQRAREAVDRARTRLDVLQEQLARVSEQLTASIGQPMASHQWATASELSERLGHSIHQAEREVQAAEEKYTAAARQRAQVATEVEALDTLRQQQWEQWRQEAQQQDQSRLDELGLRQWLAANSAEAEPQGAP